MSSASQVHGIAIAGVVAAVIILAIVARLAVSGVGPFDADRRVGRSRTAAAWRSRCR